MASILIVGATGFIGSEIARSLHRDGHCLRLAARDLRYGRRILPRADWVGADLNALTNEAAWHSLLVGIDIVINASGLLQSSPGDDVRRVQEQAIIALGAASAAARVSRIVQISAAGMAGNTSDFMASKAAADAALLAGPVPAVVLRPGLVIGRNAYGGTQLIRMMAALPVGLHARFDRQIQSIALEDLIAGVARAIDGDKSPVMAVDLVSSEALTLAAIVRAHRHWLGLPIWRFEIAVPPIILRVASGMSDAFGWLGWRSPLRRNAMAALANGVKGDAAVTRDWLRREPLTLSQTLDAMPSGKQDRFAAVACALLPAAFAALFAMWFLSGLAALIDIDRAAAIMARTGVAADAARALTVGGAAADIALALALLVRRWSQRALIGMVILAAIYLLLGTLLLPGLWFDPLAPYAKVFPTIALALLLHPLLDRR